MDVLFLHNVTSCEEQQVRFNSWWHKKHTHSYSCTHARKIHVRIYKYIYTMCVYGCVCLGLVRVACSRQ